MKKMFALILCFAVLFPVMVKADTMQVSGNTSSARNYYSVTVNTFLNSYCKAAYIGTSQSLDFSPDGINWVTFPNAAAGTELTIQFIGVRKTSGSAAPSSGDVICMQ